VAGGRDGVENVESDSVETQQIDPSLPGHRSTLHCAPCLWMTVSESFCWPGWQRRSRRFVLGRRAGPAPVDTKCECAAASESTPTVARFAHDRDDVARAAGSVVSYW
jgi:hypothetical protein